MPSFLFILAGGPLVEATRGELRLTAPLTAITAAVVGVILNLGVFFAWLAYRNVNPELATRQTLDLMVQRAYAVMSNDVLIAIPLFVFMGYLVERAALRTFAITRIAGVAKTKLTNAWFDSRLKTVCTLRNLNTCQALLALAEGKKLATLIVVRYLQEQRSAFYHYRFSFHLVILKRQT